MPAVEALGSPPCCAWIKPATSTLNRMAVQQLSVAGEIYTVNAANNELPETFHELLEFAVLSSEPILSIRWKKPSMS